MNQQLLLSRVFAIAAYSLREETIKQGYRPMDDIGIALFHDQWD